MSGRFFIFLSTFLTLQNRDLVQTLLFAENKRQGKQKDSFLNHNHTASLGFRTYPLKGSGVISFCPEFGRSLNTVDGPSFVYNRVVQLHACEPILAREVIFLARDKSRVIRKCRLENIYLVVVFVVFDCVYVFAL